MSDKKGQFHNDDLDLEAILAEFAPGSASPPPVEEDLSGEPADDQPTLLIPEATLLPLDTPPPQTEERDNVVSFPGAQPPEEPEEEDGEALDQPEEEDEPPREAKAPVSEAPAAPDPMEEPTQKVILFPGEDQSVTGRLGRLLDKADAYAEQMFLAEDEDEEATRRQEALLPGVDWEDEEAEERRAKARTRKPPKVRRPPPDLPPAELAAKYGKGLGWLRIRTLLSVLPALALLYLTLGQVFHLPLSFLADNYRLTLYCAAGLLGLSALLGLDVFWRGLLNLFRLRPDGDTLVALAVMATLADSLTMPALGSREGMMPYCVVSAFSLFFALWGRFLKLRGLRQTCRVAAAVMGAEEPCVATLDDGLWNGKPTFTKDKGDSQGYGSQIQAPDGAQRLFRVAVPLLLIACVLFSLLASAGRGAPERVLWCLSATLSAAASFSSLLVFALPFSSLVRRLAKAGVALGGWDGIKDGSKSAGVLLTDADLFPPGSVNMNGIKVMEGWSLTQVLSFAATLIRASGSGLDKPFRDIIRTEGGAYRKATQVVIHEGGVTGRIADRQIMIGSAAFMTLMEIALPPGLSVKNAVFCVVDGELAGIFALQYQLHSAVAPALESLIQSKLTPVLATRDFNLIPAMLRQRFKLPVEKMEFPNLDRRLELSAENQSHSRLAACLLRRDGIGPYAEGLVGGKRLVYATRLAGAVSVVGSAVGALLAFYLTYMEAYASLSPLTLLVFLFLWLVPTLLISGWVNRY